MMNSSGLECEVCVVTLSGLKVKEGGFRVKFVKICEWFDGSDRLDIIFKSWKTRFPIVFYFKYDYKLSLYKFDLCRKIINMQK